MTTLIGILTIITSPAKAQDNYVPPAMFGAPPVQETKPEPEKPAPKEPKVQTAPEPITPQKTITIEKTKPQKAPVQKSKPKEAIVIKPPIIQPKKIKTVKPVEKLKPVEKVKKIEKVKPSLQPITVTNIQAPKEIIEPLPIVEPKKEVITPPVQALKEEIIKPAPIKEPEPIAIKPAPAKTSSQGVVKGPKVMPAIKKQEVETEILFAPSNNKQIDLIDRVQPKHPVIEEAEGLASIDLESLPELTTQQNGLQGMSVMFTPNMTTLDAKIKATLKKLVSEFNEIGGQKIQIESYASATSDGLSIDRRIALSRALAIRSYLTERGIESRYIEVRALGADEIAPSLGQTKDRAELTIVK